MLKEGGMQEQSITLYAQWEADRHDWMIVDEASFNPLVRATSADLLMAAYERREKERRRQPGA